MAARNNAKYPWADWFRGRKFRLTAGVHFSCSLDHMRIQVYAAARRLLVGRRVWVRVDRTTMPGTIDVEVVPEHRGKRRPGRAQRVA